MTTTAATAYPTTTTDRYTVTVYPQQTGTAADELPYRTVVTVSREITECDETAERIARQALRNAAALLDDVEGERFPHFTRYAHCDRCPCTPGLVVPGGLFFGGQPVEIRVEPARDER